MDFNRIWNLLTLGGPMTIPLLFASVFSLAVIIEKAIFFYRHNDSNSRLIKRIEILVEEGDILSALNELKGKTGTNAKLLSAA
ncbi:MAG: MotA/TolQ/ExbB proton channel family protein, partial [Bacillota bacterium]